MKPTMNLLHCADLHIGCCPEENETRRLDYVAGFSRAVDHAIARGADALLIGGDFFHQRSIEPRTLRAAEGELRRLQAAGIPAIATEGNHDKAYYAMRESWLQYLDSAGLLILLKPVYDEEGHPHIPPYAEGRGAVYTYRGARFVGLGFLGAATRVRLMALERELPPYDGPTIALLHSGVDHLRGLDMGAISSEDLAAWRDRVDCFLLGHVHARFENGWAFNPGAPESIHMGEGKKERGYYWITLRGKADVSAEFLPAEHRPTRYAVLDVGGIALAELPARAIEAAAGTGAGELLSLTLRGVCPYALDSAALRQALMEAYHPLLIELRDETRDPASAAPYEPGGDRAALEREVLAALAREQGLPAEAAGAAQALAAALREKQPPAALYTLLADYIAEWKEGDACASSN